MSGWFLFAAFPEWFWNQLASICLPIARAADQSSDSESAPEALAIAREFANAHPEETVAAPGVGEKRWPPYCAIDFAIGYRFLSGFTGIPCVGDDVR